MTRTVQRNGASATLSARSAATASDFTITPRIAWRAGSRRIPTVRLAINGRSPRPPRWVRSATALFPILLDSCQRTSVGEHRDPLWTRVLGQPASPLSCQTNQRQPWPVLDGRERAGTACFGRMNRARVAVELCQGPERPPDHGQLVSCPYGMTFERRVVVIIELLYAPSPTDADDEQT